MKNSLLFLVGALLAAAYAYPASTESKSSSSDPENDAEYIVVPLTHQRPSYYNRYPSNFDGFDGVIDTGDFPHAVQSPVFFPSVNPFTWQFSSYLDDLMRRLRDRFAGSWNPFYGGADFGPSAGPGLWPIDIPDESSEDGKVNSTSTVKVIDGHKVIINDTYYTKKNEFGTSIFKVRVIDVKPADEETPKADEEPAATEQPASFDTGNRSGIDVEEVKPDQPEAGEEAKPAEPAPAADVTEAPKRDTELDASDELLEDATPADENLNTIESDIDDPKKEEVITEASSTAASSPSSSSDAVASEEKESVTTDASTSEV